MNLKNLTAINPEGIFEKGDSFFCLGGRLSSIYNDFGDDFHAEPFIATAHAPSGCSLSKDIFKVTLGDHKGWRHRSTKIFKQLEVGQGWIFSCGTNDGEIHKVIKGVLANIAAKNNFRCARQQITLANISTGEVIQGYYVEVTGVIDGGEQS